MDVWSNWISFLESSKRNDDINQYSPERHGVIRCGKGISSEPNIPKELYKKYSKARENAEEYVMSIECQTYIESAINNSSFEEFEEEIRSFPVPAVSCFDMPIRYSFIVLD